MKRNFPITERQWIKIFKIACRDWKDKIAEYIESDVKELSHKEVKEMFSASTVDQEVVLRGIFPDFKEDKNAFCATFDCYEAQSLSKKLFNNSYALQIANSAYPEGRRDLVGRAFYVSRDYKVILHKNNVGGSTTIEIIKK